MSILSKSDKLSNRSVMRIHLSFVFTGLVYLLLILGTVNNMEAQVIEWQEETSYDFGLINDSDKVNTTFSFKNVSEVPIFIDNIRVSCGCTSPDWQKTAIAPDSLTTIQVVFNPDHQGGGYFQKKVRVFVSEQRRAEILYIEGEIEK